MDALKIFEDVEEFELLLGGCNVINLEDWKENTVYKDGYTDSTQVIQWFWMALEELNQDQLRIFLQFSTGSTRLPIEGFKGLISNRGKHQKFTIVAAPEPNSTLIRSQTCFNRIYLPLFESQEQLSKAIVTIVSNKDLWLHFDYE